MLAAVDCPAYILAGGQSSRFGSDKALLDIDGQPQLLRLHSRLADLGHAVQVVSDRADRFESLGLASIVDARAEAGPMAGLVAALLDRRRRGPGWLLLVSCDQLHWQAAWFEQLATRTQSKPCAVAPVGTQKLLRRGMNSALPPEPCAVAPVGAQKLLRRGMNSALPPEPCAVAPAGAQQAGEAEFLQPIPALYHTCLLPDVILQLQRNQRSLRRLLIDLAVPTVAMSPSPSDWTFNTRNEFETLRQRSTASKSDSDSSSDANWVWP